MTNIEIGPYTIIGTSECGRITYCAGQDGPQIDGRWAWRGSFVDLSTGLANAGKVAPNDWAIACEVMGATGKVATERAETQRQEIEEAQAAREDREEAALRKTSLYWCG